MAGAAVAVDFQEEVPVAVGKIPVWAQEHLSEDDLAGIETAIRQAELATSGEIIPIIVRSSTPTWATETICALLGVVLGLLVNDLLDLSLVWGALISVSLAFVGYGLSRIDFVHRWLSPNDWLLGEVAQRAEIEFFRCRIHHTEKQTGILIFLSLAEHRVLVMGDQAISERIQQKDWDALVAEIIQGVRQKRLGPALQSAIRMGGEVLMTHFPRYSTDTNELPNQLIFKE